MSIVQQFKEYLISEKGLSPLTIMSYTSTVRSYSEMTRDFSDTNILITKKKLEEFLSFLYDEGLSSTTVRHHCMVLKVFSRFLKNEGIIDVDELKDVIAPKAQHHIPTILTTLEIDSLISACNKTSHSLRNQAIILLLYSSGIRVSELCDLKKSHFKNGTIRVIGKGRKERVVPVAPIAQRLCNEYAESILAQKTYFFEGKLGKKLTRTYIWKCISDITKKAEIQKNIHPHTLRHSYATHLVENGADIRIVQELLGHSSIATTERYVHLAKKAVSENFKKFHPLE